MQVFQPRHKLRFRLEAANKIRTIGELWQNDLDRDIALDQRLVGTVNRAEASYTEEFVQLIAPYNLSTGNTHAQTVLPMRKVSRRTLKQKEEYYNITLRWRIFPVA